MTALSVDAGALTAPLAGAAWIFGEPAASLVGPAPPVDIAGFSFVAASADVTIYHAERFVANDGPPSEPTRMAITGAAALGAVGDGDAARLLVVPGVGCQAAAMLGIDGAIRLTAGSDGVWPNPERVTGAPRHDIDRGRALQVERLGDRLVRVSGCMRLILDGVDLQLASSQGASTVHTRADVDQGGQVNVGRSSYAAHSIVHEAVIDLVDATLMMPASEIHVASATLTGIALSLESTKGQVTVDGSDLPIDAGSIEMAGALQGHLERVAGHLIQARFDGDLAAMSIDGHAVAIPQDEPSASIPWTALALGITAACLPIAAHASLGRWRFGRLDAAMDRKEYGRALHLAGAFRGHTALAQDAALAAAICLLSLGRAQEAAERLAAQPRWAMQRRPTRDFLLARAAAAVGQRHEATRLLAGSLLADPVLVAQARADPLLAGLLRPLGATPAGEAYA
jgi:hypothetical protein